MQYRKDKYGNPLSVLGFGCMRFQRKLGNIDLEEAPSVRSSSATASGRR